MVKCLISVGDINDSVITIIIIIQCANVFLFSFCLGNNITPFEQLDLAMLWNRVDIARNNIFCGDGNWTVRNF